MIIINNLKFHKTILLTGLLLVMFFSCGGGTDDDYILTPEEPEVIMPSDLILTITIVGSDDTNPNGDGLGVIKCAASATDAIKYKFSFGTGDQIESTTGNVEHTYNIEGVNKYIISVTAYSSTDDYIYTSEQITVFVSPPAFDDLIFSDEFDIDGSPDNLKWGYDIGTGSNGWGNGESQYYTSRTDNVIVEDGFLKITAKKENYQGSEYTSTRMLTKDKFEFKYGKVEVRAKIPEGGGTWPAIWMLGANFDTVGWPTCGEVDIMEHAGNNQGTVQSAMHTSSSSGDTVNKGSQYLEDVSTAFHVYSVEWTSEKMVFSIDDDVHYTYNPSNKNNDTWPFDADQFIILNVAMGGGFGGVIDPNFTQSNMEIDYIRVYQ